MTKKQKKNLLQWALIIAVFFSFRAYQQSDLSHGIVPSFQSKGLTGQSFSSNNNTPKLIHFWATWCGVCRLENDNIQSLSQDYEVLNIAMQSGTDAELIEYAKQNNLVLDNIINDNNASLAKILGVKATPTSFFINQQNQIEFIEIGYTSTIGYKLRLWWASL
jgi:thiol-disulfide isomerase/thioredoxin